MSDLELKGVPNPYELLPGTSEEPDPKKNLDGKPLSEESNPEATPPVLETRSIVRSVLQDNEPNF
ncbi:MAG: hypothetical protein AB7J40_03155 [Candidatus Altimarinota bacterium]